VGEAEDYASLTAALRNAVPDVLLLDISLPGSSGIDVLKAMRERHPKLAVLMLSMFPEDQYGMRALKAGASGYLTKDAAPERLIEAVRCAAAGKKYISPGLAALLAERLSEPAAGAPHERLSDREFETLKLIASGRKLSEMAEQMHLSPKTVSVYRARLLEKLNLRSNTELAHYAIRNGLID
jgi:DNA-binding NarL/FixJ family response regulator